MSKRYLGLSLVVCLAAGCQLSFPFLGRPIGGPGSETGGVADVRPAGDVSLVDVKTIAGTAIRRDGGGNSVFNQPSCIAVDSNGFIFVGDEPGQIKRVAPDGQVSVFAGAHEGYADGAASAARFRQPRGLAFGKYGDLIVSDTYNHRIRRIASDGTVTTIAGSGEAGFADGQGASAKFNHPADLEVDPSGRILVADALNSAIRRVSPDGIVSTLARDAELSKPDGMALAPDGSLYVAESESGFLRRVSRDGEVTTIGNFRVNIVIAGPGISGFNFSGPFDVAIDSKGRLLLAGADRLIRVEAAGLPTTLAGYTLFEATMAEGAVYASNAGAVDGPGFDARFFGLNRLAFGPDGALYASEIANRLVRKFTFRPES